MLSVPLDRSDREDEDVSPVLLLLQVFLKPLDGLQEGVLLGIRLKADLWISSYGEADIELGY